MAESRPTSMQHIRIHTFAANWVLLLSLALPPVLQGEPALPDVKRLQTSPVLSHLRPNPMTRPPSTAAERTLARMYLPEGFRADLVAAEPDVHQPIAFAWDAKGRIWLAEAYSYPQRRPVGEGLDRILILEDADGDGRFEGRKVFVEGLNLVSGLEVGYGGVWVGAAPELLFIPDQNQDDVPDASPRVLLDGFGYQDTHECLNSFLWGPDGWLYGNQGVFNLAYIGRPGTPESQRKELRAGVWRYHPIRHQLEIFAHGGSNPWGLDYDERGQLFMTHCRSYWGGGCTTHVIQGGQFWNQANANYPGFIVADPPAAFPGFRNYLLASARYDHGAGGAGKPGTDAVYGGHSHVGTMIYLGDNWPDSFRGHLFTHNLGGHQMNHQVNRRLGSGFETFHAGQDHFFCTDPAYVPVDLQYGPDGAVYVIDWYDIQHCHNPNTEQWDRGNGRVYRLAYSSSFQPARVDLGKATDSELAKYQTHRNQWHARIARRLIHERAQTRSIDAQTVTALRALLNGRDEEPVRLGALWSLHLAGVLSEADLVARLHDSQSWVRAWSVQLLTDRGRAARTAEEALVHHSEAESASEVRLYLASSLQRVSADAAWRIAANLSRRKDDAGDRNLPWLLWHGVAPLMSHQLEPAIRLARETAWPQISDYVYWYAATLSPKGMESAVSDLGRHDGEILARRLAGLEMAVGGRQTLDMPAGWSAIAGRLQQHPDAGLRRQAEFLSATFGDRSRFAALRGTLADTNAPTADRQHAFRILARVQEDATVPILLGLLDQPGFRSRTLPVLARFDSPGIAPRLIAQLPAFPDGDRMSALGVLASRPGPAIALLTAVSEGRVPRDWINSLHVRQFSSFRNPEIDRHLSQLWGRLVPTSAEKQSHIQRMEKTFNEAPLWAYDGGAGRAHFVKLCSACHRLGNEGARIGPELTGSGRHGIRYMLENIIDPNSVVGRDFQVTTIERKDGELVSGIVVARGAASVTLRTVTESVEIPKADILSERLGENSLMPEGLLESLPPREQIELLKFLSSN